MLMIIMMLLMVMSRCGDAGDPYADHDYDDSDDYHGGQLADLMFFFIVLGFSQE